MSTTTSSSPTSTTSAAPSTTTTSGSTTSLTSSASLYLYTFLATLVLLLSVSAAIVVRSYILRRRQRLLIEEAIQNGNYFPPSQRARKFGEKPKLHDAYLSFRSGIQEKIRYENAGGSDMETGSWWRGTMPIAGALIRNSLNSRDAENSSEPPARPTLLSAWHQLSSRAIRSVLPPSSAFSQDSDLNMTPHASSQPPVTSPIDLASNCALVDGQKFNLAFLVAMPNPHGPCSMGEEGQLPHLEFGIAQVPVRVIPEET
ncbi:uncharacterized protein FIBRA_08852 [Fibroporia radiculosa]|uniref:Uncharacterized protein n=1 Tax=Fibroporia radiculosa TaxID=599839 RepID=J4H5E0_9APHY|nr:uncharacterized protein FIBRA_08852 [Fibroporia radiculosa]CCM06574.1 predicted protein [Fibroporia radiculosa]